MKLFLSQLFFFGTPKSSQTLPEALPGTPGALPEASTHPAVRIEPVMLAETLAARAAVIRIGRRPLLHRHAMHARRQQTSASKPLHTCSSSAIDLPHIDKCASSLHCSPNRFSQFQHLYGLAEAHSCDAAQHTCYPKRRCSIKTIAHLLKHCHRLPTRREVRLQPALFSELLVAIPTLVRLGRGPLLGCSATHMLSKGTPPQANARPTC